MHIYVNSTRVTKPLQLPLDLTVSKLFYVKTIWLDIRCFIIFIHFIVLASLMCLMRHRFLDSIEIRQLCLSIIHLLSITNLLEFRKLAVSSVVLPPIDTETMCYTVINTRCVHNSIEPSVTDCNEYQ